jgi:hypothetical protein
MKYGMYFGLAVLILSFGVTGCQQHNIRNTKGHEYGVPDNSIDGYAKSHGISRAEAAKRMRADLVPPGDSKTAPNTAETTAATLEPKNK